MCLIVSVYLHVLFLSVGFMYNIIIFDIACMYIYLKFVCITSICGFYVSLSSDIVYMYIHLFIEISDLLVLMLFVLQCTDYE